MGPSPVDGWEHTSSHVRDDTYPYDASGAADLLFQISQPFGSFGQLLQHATSGLLYQNSQESIGNYVEPFEGYEAGEDDDSDGYGHQSEDFEDTEDESGQEPDNEDDSDAQDIEDNIPVERFLEREWDDSEYDNGPRGVDDTAYMCESEVEVVDNVEIFGGDVTEENTEGIDAEPSAQTMLGDCGCAAPQFAQEISSQYLESLKKGYKTRKKKGVQTDGPDCRKPRDLGAIDIAILLAGTRDTPHIFEPVLGMVFDSDDEGYQFYNMYSWEAGFGIVKARCTKRQSDPNYRSMQEFCCERSGIDRRVNGSTKKILCKARMKMLRDDDGGWYVSDFVKEHNHPFAESCSEKREWFSHHRLDEGTLETVRQMRLNNVGQTTVRCVVGKLFGGLKGAPCTKRTIRAISNQIARERMDGDVAKTMELFKKMKAEDPEFQWSVETGEDSRINTLMWCSGRSREQYACFGDVVTFDTTYCTNVYKMPFGLFVGVNNHFQTTVFGGVLMRSETTESFEWVFKEFINLMGGRPPKTVLTDQCKAMTIALGRVWPQTFHLWCKWHVLKKIRESLGPAYTKDATFRSEFYALIAEMMTKDEFEKSWHDLCSRYKLADNPFMIRTFQCRSKWAKPWSEGHFCAGMTSTQRSESANWMLKKFVPRNSSMNHFVSQFNLLLEDREMEEGREDNLTKQLFVKYNRLWPIERHAIKVYTRQALKLFRKQVDLAANFKVTQTGAGYYIVERNSKEMYPERRKKKYIVNVCDNGARYHCECGLFEHVGILCCHTIRVMIRMEIDEIPEIHILTRWTRNAKDVVPQHMRFSGAKVDATGSISIWQQRLNTKSLEACSKGNSYRETYDIVMRHLNNAIKEVDEFLEQKKMEENEQADISEVESMTDAETAKKNRYGASGSSAGMSDPEIQQLRAPEITRSSGRPRCKRFLSSSEKGSRCPKRKKTQAKPKNKINGVMEGETEHRGLPKQTRFCSKCRQPGHTKRNCAYNVDGSEKGNPKVVCAKCGLEGHNESECLVVDMDTDGFFR